MIETPLNRRMRSISDARSRCIEVEWYRKSLRLIFAYRLICFRVQNQSLKIFVRFDVWWSDSLDDFRAQNHFCRVAASMQRHLQTVEPWMQDSDNLRRVWIRPRWMMPWLWWFVLRTCLLNAYLSSIARFFRFSAEYLRSLTLACHVSITTVMICCL